VFRRVGLGGADEICDRDRRAHALYNTATAEFVEVVRNFIHTGRPGAV